jgi:hypothetical protein
MAAPGLPFHRIRVAYAIAKNFSLWVAKKLKQHEYKEKKQGEEWEHGVRNEENKNINEQQILIH